MSASSRPTFAPSWASATATLAETVLLPTPPLPLPMSTTFFAPGTRSCALVALAGDWRTFELKAISTRCPGSAARMSSSSFGLCGEAGVGSSTCTRTALPESVSAPLSIPSSPSGRPDEGSFKSFSAERTCSDVMGRGMCLSRGVKSRRVKQRASRARLRALAVVEDEPAVHDYVGHSVRVLERLFEGGRVAHRGGIEGDQVRLHTDADQAAVLQAEPPRRQGGHLPHRLFQKK